MTAGTRIEGWQIIAPESQYDFSSFAHVGEITRRCMETFLNGRSTGDNPASRSRTNQTLYYKTLPFLRFISKLANDGTPYGLDAATLFRFDGFLAEKYKSTTHASYIEQACSIVRHAISAGKTEEFQIPRFISFGDALLHGNGGTTLADRLGGYKEDGLEQTDLNRKAMVALKSFCWSRIRMYQRNFGIGQRLKGIALDQDIDFRQKLILADNIRSRREALAVMIMAAWKHSDGVLPIWHPSHKEHDVDALEVRRLIADASTQLKGRFDPEITIDEVSTYLQPSHDHHCVFLPIFAAARLNPTSIIELQTDMIAECPYDTTKRDIYWEKGRAHGEQKSGSFSVGSSIADTIPRAWEIAQSFSDAVRGLARPEDRNRLFLARYTRLVSGEHSVRPITLNNAMERLTLAIRASVSPDYEILRSIEGIMRLKIIRTTAINLIALKQGHPAAQRAAKHRSMSTTQNYLNNSTIKAHLNVSIERGQKFLYQEIMKKPLLIPHDKAYLESEVGLDAETSEEMISDKLNLGFGVSLVDDKAYVVDTPLNCLRMVTWTERIERARDRLVVDNPERWHRFWEPVLHLYLDAIEDFPSCTRVAARTLGKEIVLSFPEPV